MQNQFEDFSLAALELMEIIGQELAVNDGIFNRQVNENIPEEERNEQIEAIQKELWMQIL